MSIRMTMWHTLLRDFWGGFWHAEHKFKKYLVGYLSDSGASHESGVIMAGQLMQAGGGKLGALCTSVPRAVEPHVYIM